jgi:hypothetical protein
MRKLWMLVLVGCGASTPSAATVAMRTYEGEQAACVAVYSTRAEIDACRSTVRRIWGQEQTAPPLSIPGPLARDGGF